jgi:hypothetical protein
VAPAPAQAAHRVSSCERAEAPPGLGPPHGQKAHSGTYETHQRPPMISGGGGEAMLASPHGDCAADQRMHQQKRWTRTKRLRTVRDVSPSVIH